MGRIDRCPPSSPAAQAVEKPIEQPTPKEETSEQTWERSLRRWLGSDWTPHFEAQQERAELEEIDRSAGVLGEVESSYLILLRVTYSSITVQ